jgi:Subtilase family
VADFSSFGKVDVVAPGQCVPVVVVPDTDQETGRIPCEDAAEVAHNSGSSLSAPIVAGVLALAESPSPWRPPGTARPAATGSPGRWRRAGPPITVPVPACSPNGDGVRDRCAWAAGALGSWTVASFVTSGDSSLYEVDGPGSHTWDGAAGPGGYRLRVLYFEPGSDRVLLRAFTLVVDLERPEIARAAVAPNPFEPRPHDGDRDTATFAMTSSEAGRLRVIVYRRASTTVVRAFRSGPQAVGHQRVGRSGRSDTGAWLRGRYVWVIEATDAAGNTARSGRHGVRVL